MTSLENEINWFKRVMNFRMLQFYDRNEWPEKIKNLAADEQEKILAAKHVTDLQPPDITGDNSSYGWLVNNYELNGWERLALVLALTPSVNPRILDVFFQKNQATGTWVTEYGGVKTSGHKGFLPSGETFMFLAAENDSELRFALLEMFSDNHKFRKANILSLEPSAKGEPELSGALLASRETIDIITRGQVRPPEYGTDFPAKRIFTEMDWADLVLAPSTRRQVEEVKIWLRQRDRLMTELDMKKRLKPGYKILFHGSPGTGKTLTACLLGKFTGKSVFRIDLSLIVSKYIGETEKNLAKVFDKAEHSGWILFFDEADALFGSRTKVNSSHDRFANQEVSYLLQRIEDYNGIVILASNMKGNIDDAFMRRFSSVVNFPFPRAEERQQLWQKAFPGKLNLSGEVDIKKLSDKYEMSGANITNVVAWCSLMALENGDYKVTDAMLREGMARELAKEGRTI